jgi:DtxR family Mn-dependent transcriptional regulator
MNITNTAEEILEILWVLLVENKRNNIKLEDIKFENKESAVSELVKIGFISIKNNIISFSNKGKKYAQNVIRRHRIAERLLVDVLSLNENIADSSACQFEHILHPEVEESICTLLGHPKVCPHGKSIPPGDCCLKSKWVIESKIKPLSALNPGNKGIITYIHTGNNKTLQKLMAMGVLPGRTISLLHKFPSYVFKIGHSQTAIDREIASEIYVRMEK